METTFYFISFYYSNSRRLFLFETRKMVCYSDDEFSILKAECRKHCRQIFRNGYGRKSLRELHADGMLVSALDDIAWTLDLGVVRCSSMF